MKRSVGGVAAMSVKDDAYCFRTRDETLTNVTETIFVRTLRESDSAELFQRIDDNRFEFFFL